MLILIAKRYQNYKVKHSLASITLAKSSVFRSNKPESYSTGVPARVRTHADSEFTSLICFWF